MTNRTINPLAVLRTIHKNKLLSKYLHLKGNRLYSGSIASMLGFGPVVKKKKKKPTTKRATK